MHALPFKSQTTWDMVEAAERGNRFEALLMKGVGTMLVEGTGAVVRVSHLHC